MEEKVLICGEGPTDYGTQEYGTRKWLEGPVQPIARKCTQKKLVFEAVDKNDLKRLRIQGRAGVQGHAAKSYKLSIIAKERNINNIICYVDADKIPGKGRKDVNARQSFIGVYDALKEGFELFKKRFPGKVKGKSIHGIPMVPLRMIESWLLSDQQAFKKCFGKSPTNPRLPEKPELLWGEKNDPVGDYPKNRMKRVLAQYHGVEGNRETFKQIAEETDIETLRQKCPISVEPFYKNMRKL